MFFREVSLMLDSSFPPWPQFSNAEIQAVSRVLASGRVNYWTGDECREFEREFAAAAGCKYAIAVANGTVALEFALLALGIGVGDEVVVTPRSFIASVSAVVRVGAIPIFADVDRDTQNLTAASIERVLTDRTRAVILVHLAGLPCDLAPIIDLASRRAFFVIEDCAQSTGARYRGKSVGGFGEVGAWSFCQDKIVTTGGEGGMLTCNDDDLFQRLWSLKDHGKSWSASNQASNGREFRWLHESFGTNGRMLELQAAIGRLQLRNLPAWLEVRRSHASQIWTEAKRSPALRVLDVPLWAEHAAYKAYVFVQPDALRSGWSRDRILGEVNARGVPCFVGSCSEIYLERAFEGTPWRPADRLPAAKELGETSLMFLVHPTLQPTHISLTCEVLADVMRSATR